jgi:hypothetical protein
LLGVTDGVKDGVSGVKMPVDGNGEVDWGLRSRAVDTDTDRYSVKPLVPPPSSAADAFSPLAL